MKREFSEEDEERLIEALDFLAAYKRTRDRDPRPYMELAEQLQAADPLAKAPARETAAPVRGKVKGKR